MANQKKDEQTTPPQLQERSQGWLSLWEGDLQSLWIRLRRVFTPTVLFLLVFALGIYARVWQFGQVPPGLNKDEASIGVEAYDLLHYGIDRNGMSFPVNFVSWGSGQDAPYAYLLIPFIRIGGLSPIVVRLPMLITGILTLPLVFFVARRMLGIEYGLVAMFLISISPWHIILSRWALEDNLLPFVFLLAVACLMKSSTTNYWFIAAGVFFALCLYTYGSAYVAVPVFILCAAPVLLYAKRITVRNLLLGLGVFILLGSPIGLLVLINTLHLNSIQIGIFTIPRYPIQARFLGLSASSTASPIRAIFQNISSMMRMLLITQSDGLIWNVVEPYGYMFAFSLPLAALGALLLISRRQRIRDPGNLLILGWLVASLCIGAIISVNINRINLIFIPLILCIAAFLVWLGKQQKLLLAGMIVIYLLDFYAFNNEYHRGLYQRQTSAYFEPSLLTALNYVREKKDQPVCVTSTIDMAYIYVLFSEGLDPSQYLSTIQYYYPGTDYRDVLSLGRYTFGFNRCSDLPNTIYVTQGTERPPQGKVKLSETDFEDFHVYTPSH